VGYWCSIKLPSKDSEEIKVEAIRSKQERIADWKKEGKPGQEIIVYA